MSSGTLVAIDSDGQVAALEKDFDNTLPISDRPEQTCPVSVDGNETAVGTAAGKLSVKNEWVKRYPGLFRCIDRRR